MFGCKTHPRRVTALNRRTASEKVKVGKGSSFSYYSRATELLLEVVATDSSSCNRDGGYVGPSIYVDVGGSRGLIIIVKRPCVYQLLPPFAFVHQIF